MSPTGTSRGSWTVWGSPTDMMRTLRAARRCAALASLVALPLAAQQPRRAAPVASATAMGSLRGVVYDSLLRQPLAGARVTLRGTRLAAATDGAGRFRFDSVPAGEVVVGFSHPALDSAGLSNLVRRVRVAAGTQTVVELAVPSLWTLRRLACRNEPSSVPDSGLVLGAVTDAESGERVAGASVVVSWITASRGPEGVRVRRPRLVMTTDSLGNFYGCNVSTDLVVTVQATTPDSFRSGVVELLVGPRGVARYDLTVSREALPGARDTTGPLRGLATLIGTIRDEHGNPRPSVNVVVDDAEGMAYTDSAGRFELSGLPSGSHMLLARMVGYSAARRRVDLRNRDTTRIALVMRQVTVLDTLRIIASSRSSQNLLDELDRRMRTGTAHFLLGEEVRHRSTMRAVFQGLPAMVIQGQSTYDFRMYTLAGAFLCPVSLWVDGIRTDADAVQSYRPDQIVAVEYYQRGQNAPVQYRPSGSSDCAVLLLWTTLLR